ncbi:hypothetical protein CWE15_08990 [Aliidiomarina taiwanensis]|uniref:FlgO domain-containing protein n=1 Tax=Aliidiomarina taiwanensis TaxID=946228 RepID=A0A432X1F7_9GAMM|nr:FlgO family outer membrane protein [Aliidiomarina taiwanensis]RUO39877.1 hypothetical protein CWE15_08990 [Aliidiomarina taiwanensis]
MKHMLVTLIGLVFLTACSSPTLHRTAPVQVSVSEYSNQLANQILASARGVHAGDRVVVTSPVWLESGMTESSLFGLQLQQDLSAELHSMALNVIDFKLTDGIRVTPEGDFALSTNYLELRELQAADFILVGTLVNRDDSLLVSLRLLDFTSQVVVATAQVAIPETLISDLSNRNSFKLVNSDRQ